MKQIKCKICDKEFTSLWGLSRHNSQKHNMSSEMTYINYNLSGVEPTCGCGCGEKPTFLSIKKGYNKFIRGHSSRVNNNWGHNPDALKKSHATQKLMHEAGALKVWNDGLTIDDIRVRDNINKVMSNPNRSKNISKALIDVPKSEEHIRNISEGAKTRWSDPKERELQSHRRMLWMKENDYTVKSNLEEIINTIFITLDLEENVDYERQYYIRDNKSYYDFKLYKNNILIEVDGDFWHCNPNSKYKTPKYECQFKNLKKDKIKNEWCKDNNITLIRFWEYDIKNNLDEVISKLKELL